MEKLKTFYNEHKRAVFVGAVGLGVGAVVGTRVIRGREFVSASVFNHPDGRSVLMINRKSGKHPVMFHNNTRLTLGEVS